MQGCDLVAFSPDGRERLSSSHTFAFEETTKVGLFSRLWSHCANARLTIVHDTVGEHDLHLPPCSSRSIAHFTPEDGANPVCKDALGEAIRSHGITPDVIDTSFSVFTNIRLDPMSGTVVVGSPHSIAPGTVKLRAEQDLLIGLSTCSSAMPCEANQPSIQFAVEPGA